MPVSLLLSLALALGAPGGSAPAPGLALRLAPAQARPGDALLVTVEGAGAEVPSGSAAGRPLAFWRDPAGPWRALAALPLETPPGTVPVEVTARGEALRADLAIVDPRFPSRSLTLPEKYVQPPASVRKRIKADRAAFARAYDRPFGPARFDRLALPRDASRTGRYGDQRIVNDKQPSVHYGLDLDGPAGAPVGAAADGEVVLARDCYLSGKSVVLSHGAGLFTAYFHLSRIDVRPGVRVRLGQRIGLLGSTGRSTGPHLHWSARVDGLLVDPDSLLAIDFAAGTAPPREPRAPPPAAEPVTPPEGLELPPAPPPGGLSPEPAPPR